jgi:SecD/SecF fusion protein
MQTTGNLMKIVIVAVLLLSGFFLYPTIEKSMMTSDEINELKINDPNHYEYLLKHEINLGLDLQGGMHVLLEVDVAKLLERLANDIDDDFNAALKEVREKAALEDIDIISDFDDALENRGRNIARYYLGTDRKTKSDVLEFLYQQSDDGVKRAREIIANRVNQLGLQEPIVQVQGSRRIIAELAGVDDPSRVRQLINKTAQLEFKLVIQSESAERIAKKLTAKLQAEVKAAEAAKIDGAGDIEQPVGTDAKPAEDTTKTSIDELFGDAGADTTAVGDDGDDKAEEEQLFYALGNGLLLIPEVKADSAVAFLNREDVLEDIKREIGEAEYLLESKPVGTLGNRAYRALLVKRQPEMTGDKIEEAKGQPNTGLDISAGRFEVSMQLNSDGAKIFSRVTSANQERQLAVVLDSRIYSAPTIQVQIRDGRARITGMSSIEEARDLAIVLKAGALPAPVTILEERTVGPSLGEDSVNQGASSAIIGLFLVMIFMILYYRLNGIIAEIALIFNIIIIISFMAYLNATLTMPGIAGIILTIGMAVDANVLIFERIREETSRGKTIRAAIETGFGKAFSAILDANVTTFIASVVLYNFGTGPVKGFAVTLMLGIIASMFTALIVSRNIMVAAVDFFKIQKFQMMALVKDARFAFIANRKKAYFVSGAILLTGLIVMGLRGGPTLSIDFKGGTLVQVKFAEPLAIETVREALAATEFATSEIKHFGSGNRDVLLRLPVSTEGGEKVAKKIEDLLAANIADNPFTQERVETVGPKVGTELIWAAFFAILISMLGILIYVLLRFEFRFSLGALAALVHDVMITIGIFSLFDIEISITVIAAILTIIGYSLNDTIVVFDRIRENVMTVKDKNKYLDVMNISINETLSRTIITSVTTLIVVVILAIFGGDVIYDFAFAMIIGVIVGTYSSIFVASSVVAELFLKSHK